MSSRAAIVPVPGDPFMLAYWLHIYENVWKDEVDELIVIFNSPVEESVHKFVHQLCDQHGVTLTDINFQIDHGPAIAAGLSATEKEFIILLEDDCYIFHKGFVDSLFKAIEGGEVDAIGAQRGCTTREVLKAAEEKFGVQVKFNGHDDSGVGFWPTMFVCKKADLLRTDGHFASKTWQAGERIEEIDLTVSELTPSDTFLWASIQLHALGLRFGYISSCHGRAEDLDHYNEGANIFNGRCDYVHIGSLSSGLSGFLLYEGKRLSDGQAAEYPNYCNTEQEKQELERRVQWWKHCFDFCFEHMILAGLGEFIDKYRAAIDNCIAHYHLSEARINKRTEVYKKLMGGF